MKIIQNINMHNDSINMISNVKNERLLDSINFYTLDLLYLT